MEGDGPAGGDPAKEREKAAVLVPGEGGAPSEDARPLFAPPPNPESGADEGMSAEDKALVERLELAVERIKDSDVNVQRLALELLRKEIRESTSSMTAVPKPLKFLAPHWDTLKALYAALPAAAHDPASASATFSGVTCSVSQVFADVLAVLAMTMSAPDLRETLSFKLKGDLSDVGSWGHEFVRHLAGEVGEEWQVRMGNAPGGKEKQSVSDLLTLVRLIVPYNLAHNAEHEAVDLLLEVGHLPLLLDTDIVRGTAAAAAAATASGALVLATAAGDVTTAAAAKKPVIMLDDGEALQLPFARVCAYLLKCSDYVGDSDDAEVCMRTAFDIYMAHGDAPKALRVALKLGGLAQSERLASIFAATSSDSGMQRQLAYMLGRHRLSGFSTGDASLDALIGNQSLAELYAALARDLDTMEAKTPEDVYKSHLSGEARTGEGEAKLDSARANLAASYVNAFVNCGYGADKLLSPPDSTWVYKNKDHGQTAAAASLGLVHLWSEAHLSTLDKFCSAPEDAVRAGGLLGIGLCCTGTHNADSDAAFALLSDHLSPTSTSSTSAKVSALLGLGLAYAGSARDDVADLAVPLLQVRGSADGGIELAAIASLCIGLIFVGTSNEGHASRLTDRLLEATDAEGSSAIARHLALGLGLLFLGRQGEAEAMSQVLSATMADKPLGKVAGLLLEACAFAGTGNVLSIQKLLRVCAEHPEMEEREAARETAEAAEKERANAVAAGGAGAAGAGAVAPAVPLGSSGVGVGELSTPAPPSGSAGAPAAATGALAPTAPDRKGADVSGRFMHQSVAVLGLGLVSMGEDLSEDMAGRMADHLLQYGDAAVRRAVPLALALGHLSDPAYAIVDVLSKLSHDANEDAAQAAIFALGLVGAGTNNSRIAGLLRSLAAFHKAEPNHLFIVRIAQGFLHMGKGLVGINPFHSDRLLCCGPALGGVLITVLAALDPRATLHGKWHTLLFALATAINPRMLTTLSEAGEPLAVEARVGAAVDTVAQAGRPKAITGFQTHTTPLLLNVRDRAELVGEAHIALTTILEGVVVLRVNPAAKARKEAAEEARVERARLAAAPTRARADLAWG